MSETLRPLVPGVRLRVGVTGHRIGSKLLAESVAPIRANVDRILGATASSARDAIATHGGGMIDKNLELVVVSSLAEGADRVVADAGLSAGFALDAVLPFARDEYMRDFEGASAREAFDTLVGRASSVFELDGERDQASRAYEAAGLVMLANCDLLIAIWDQNEGAGVGGTAFIVDRAVNEGIPVVLINPTLPERADLLWGADTDLTPASIRPEDLRSRDALAEIPEVVEFLIGPPPIGYPQSNLANYFAEKERRWNVGPWFALLLFAFSGYKIRKTDFRLPPYLATASKQWAEYFKTMRRSDRLASSIEQILLRAFAAADNLSIHYARVYRSAYVFNFIAAALVATLAVFGLILHEHAWSSVVRIVEITELVIIGTVILTWWIGHRRQWHRRWLEYRRLAECLRHMRLVALTASVGPVARPGRSPEGNSDWVDWYARAIRRLLPLPHQRINSDYIEMVRRAACEAELRGQIMYHEPNAVLMRKLDHRLHVFGQFLFVATAVILLCLLAMPLTQDMRELRSVLIFLTVVFPTFGSAFNAIRAQGEFITVSKRSRLTANRLIAIKNALSEESLSFARLADRVEMASEMMMDELVEWQLVFRTRPLSLPV
jgi:hypothetical protein